MKFYLRNSRGQFRGWWKDSMNHLSSSREWVEAILTLPKIKTRETVINGEKKWRYRADWKAWISIASHCGICTFLGTLLYLLGHYQKEENK